MKMVFPSENAFEIDVKNPTIENGMVISVASGRKRTNIANKESEKSK